MKVRLCFIVLALLCCLYNQPLYGAGKYNNVLQKIYREFPELQAVSPLCVVLTSIQRCVGCGVLAVNGTMELLQQAHTTATCAVILFAEREQEADVVRDKLLSPFVIVDTAKTFLLPRFVRHYPMLLVLNNEGELLFHQADLQHAALRYTDVQKVLATNVVKNRRDAGVRWEEGKTEGEERSAQKAPTDVIDETRKFVFLDEPKGYAAGSLISPLANGTMRTVFAINSLANTIGAWDAATGALLFSLPLPDTVVYYFRTDSADRRWRDWEQQGATIAQLRSLAMARDTLCALVDIFSGYTEEKKYGSTPMGTMDTLVEIAWKKRQIVARLFNKTLLDIVEVPNSHSLIDLHGLPNGGFGGTCVWNNFRRSQPIEEQRDSLAFLRVYGSGKAVPPYQPAVQELQRRLLPERSSSYSIGLAATASNGDIWYCDPNKNALFVLTAAGSLQRVATENALYSCSGGIVLAGGTPTPDSAKKNNYSLQGMVATPQQVCILLSPLDFSSAMPHILQVYAATGEFVGEHALDTLLTNKTSSLQVVAYQNDEVVLLQRTSDKRWRVVREPLRLSSTSLSNPSAHRPVKP